MGCGWTRHGAAAHQPYTGNKNGKGGSSTSPTARAGVQTQRAGTVRAAQQHKHEAQPKSTVLSGQIQQQATALAPVKPHWLLSKARHASTDWQPATHSSPGATVGHAPRGGRRPPAQCNVRAMHAHTLYRLCGDLARSHPCRSTAATKGRPGPPKAPKTATVSVAPAQQDMYVPATDQDCLCQLSSCCESTACQRQQSAENCGEADSRGLQECAGPARVGRVCGPSTPPPPTAHDAGCATAQVAARPVNRPHLLTTHTNTRLLFQKIVPQVFTSTLLPEH
jgi:hypothetical protein